MSKKRNKVQMLVKLKPGEKEFLKEHGLYGRKCVDYAIRKIKEEHSNDVESTIKDKIIISESIIEEYSEAIAKEKLLIEKLKDDLHEIKMNPELKYKKENKLSDDVNKCRNEINLPRGFRHEVLKRDGYRCVECGAGPDDGATLHVDHIIPVSRGGTDELDNLQTLCKECNVNKSNLYYPKRNY